MAKRSPKPFKFNGYDISVPVYSKKGVSVTVTMHKSGNVHVVTADNAHAANKKAFTVALDEICAANGTERIRDYDEE